MALIKEVSSVSSDNDIFNDVTTNHADVSAVECFLLHTTKFQFNLWKNVFNRICNQARKKWMGIRLITITYRNEGIKQKPFVAVAVSGDSISLSTIVLAFVVQNIKETQEYQSHELEESEDESDDEEIGAPPELVHIRVPHSEMESWIQSFIQGKRNLVNKQNILDFCVEESKRQNCARIDAILVKRKGTSGHIKVQDIENYWGQEQKKFPHIAHVPVKDVPPIKSLIKSPGKKKVI